MTGYQLLLVMAGGGVGSGLRYLVSHVAIRLNSVLRLNSATELPLATLAVNVAGSLALGLLTGVLAKYAHGAPELKALLLTGLCGGFTTFSTFAADNVKLIQQGNVALAAVYVTVSVAAGITAVWIGMSVAK